jgi:hypothetical protein
MTKVIVAFRSFAKEPTDDDRRLSVLERKILCRIYGEIYENGQWGKRYNRELEDLYSEPNTVNVIKYSRLRWAGHVARMEENGLPKKYYTQNLGVNENVADRNQAKLTGCMKTQGRWTVETG